METDVVGLAEIADRLGVKPRTAVQWHWRGVLPEPTWKLAMGPAWDWEVIAKWARSSGRLR